MRGGGERDAFEKRAKRGREEEEETVATTNVTNIVVVVIVQRRRIGDRGIVLDGSGGMILFRVVVWGPFAAQEWV